jgi:hypothetical protein
LPIPRRLRAHRPTRAPLAVGRQGATNPVLQVDASTATVATGLKIKGAAAAGGLALSVITSGTNENLTIDAAGAGTITLGGTSTGAITLTRATTMSAALTYGGVTLSNAVTGTGNMALSASPTFTGTVNTAAITAAGQLTVSYASANFTINDTGTSFAYFQINNAANSNRVGVEQNAGGALFTGSSGNAFVLGSVSNNPMQFFTNNAARGQFTAAGDLSVVNNVVMGTSTKTLTLKQGANGTVGTFICTSGGTITITNSNVAISDGIGISLNTVGGTISTAPAVNAITAATSFTAKCATSDTSTYNYFIIKNAA